MVQVCCGDDWQVRRTFNAAPQPWMEVLRDPGFPEVIIQICSCFFSPKQTNGIIVFFLSIFIIQFLMQGRATIGHSPRPAFPLRVPMTSAALTMRHPAALRAWPLATAKYVQRACFIWLYLRMTSIACRPLAIVFTLISPPFFSCRCLAPVATLWWKGRHSIGKQSLKCGGYYSPVCTRGNQLNWAG